MHQIEENGITLSFPDANYIQFGRTEEYKKLKSHSVKEMDVCWYNAERNTFWMIELKAFINPKNNKHIETDLSDSKKFDHWLDELYTKMLHTLSMVESNRSTTKQLRDQRISDETTFILAAVLNVKTGQETYCQHIADKLNARLKPIKAIYKVSSIKIIPYSLGHEVVSWIKN